MNITRKTGLARGIQGTTSLWLDSKLSVVDIPSRGQSPGGNRAISKASLTHLNHRLLPFMGITRKLRKLSPDISLGLNKIQPGGGIEEHYHEYDIETPIFDHIYYVISGQIKATIGSMERIVGADSLIYCPSNIKHSITNVGKGMAKLIRVSGSGEGARMGGPVYSKIPSGDLGVMPWKVSKP